MLEIVATIDAFVSGVMIFLASRTKCKETAKLFIGVAVWLMLVAIFILLLSMGEVL